MQRIPLLLLLGPSGAGKSTLAAALSGTLNWLHVETDTYSTSVDVPSELGGRWKTLCRSGRFAELSTEMHRQATLGTREGVVASFGSMVMLTIDQISAASDSGIATMLLFGNEGDCRSSFLRREAETGRNLPEEHWVTYNEDIYALCDRPPYEPHRLLAFRNGAHRPVAELVAEVQARCLS